MLGSVELSREGGGGFYCKSAPIYIPLGKGARWLQSTGRPDSGSLEVTLSHRTHRDSVILNHR